MVGAAEGQEAAADRLNVTSKPDNQLGSPSLAVGSAWSPLALDCGALHWVPSKVMHLD